jgi:hypothetical protein
MSAGTLGPEAEASVRAGYTSISSGTMHQLAAAIAAEAFTVPRRDVRAGIGDEQGQLSVSLALPLAFQLAPHGPTGSKAGHDGGTVFERAARARSVVADRIEELSGASVARVDIRFTGIHHGKNTAAGRVG